MLPSMMFTLKSHNEKTGPIPVSITANQTCPDACPLKRDPVTGKSGGCYADNAHLGVMWRRLSETTAGDTFAQGRATITTKTWEQFTAAVSALPEGQLWRHNQAGDLPGDGDAIDRAALADLVTANKGRKGFTYTHKPITHGRNADAIYRANQHGFTVNLSANNLAHADQLADAQIGPVVVVLPADVQTIAPNTPKGRRVIVCPATYRDDVSCATCGLCQRQERKAIVGFPAHGTTKRKASNIAMS